MKIPVVLHKDTGSDYGVTVPDVPGCFSAGATVAQALENVQEALALHFEGLVADNGRCRRHRKSMSMWRTPTMKAGYGP